MDTLTRVLDLLRFNGAFYFATNFNAPWGIEVPTYKNVARFHYVTQGCCWVRIQGLKKARKLSKGDLIIIPHGATHILSDGPETAAITLDDAFTQTGYDGHGLFQLGESLETVSAASQHQTIHNSAIISDHHAQREPQPLATQLVCGHFEFNEEYRHPLIDFLPPSIICNENDETELSWLKESLRFLENVAKSEQIGSSAIIKRLSEIIFIQSIRFWHDGQDKNDGFLAALNDPQLSKGLRAFHNDYSAEWTVERLAQQSHMSRSLFSDRFKQYLNLSPMQYVTHWRMQNAKRMLSESDINLEKIASDIGYESLASFSKAFKRIVGENPGEYRRKRVEHHG